MNDSCGKMALMGTMDGWFSILKYIVFGKSLIKGAGFVFHEP
jgi:hypothetical protein